MISRLLTACLLGATLTTAAGDTTDPVVVYQADDDYAFVKENIQLAIMDRGMLVSGELHVSDMLNRTGGDLGFDRQVYLKAESIEFCSALMSHKMTQIDPTNLVICPFTIAVYIKADEPDQVYVAYRKQQLAGEAGEVEAAVNQMLHDIVSEAIE